MTFVFQCFDENVLKQCDNIQIISHDYFREGHSESKGKFSVIFPTLSLPLFGCFCTKSVSVNILHMCHFSLLGELSTFSSGIMLSWGTYEKRKVVLLYLKSLGMVLTELCLYMSRMVRT